MNFTCVRYCEEWAGSANLEVVSVPFSFLYEGPVLSQTHHRYGAIGQTTGITDRFLNAVFVDMGGGLVGVGVKGIVPGQSTKLNLTATLQFECCLRLFLW
jgi:hypothetical protein